MDQSWSWFFACSGEGGEVEGPCQIRVRIASSRLNVCILLNTLFRSNHLKRRVERRGPEPPSVLGIIKTRNEDASVVTFLPFRRLLLTHHSKPASNGVCRHLMPHHHHQLESLAVNHYSIPCQQNNNIKQQTSFGSLQPQPYL